MPFQKNLPDGKIHHTELLSHQLPDIRREVLLIQIPAILFQPPGSSSSEQHLRLLLPGIHTVYPDLRMVQNAS